MYHLYHTHSQWENKAGESTLSEIGSLYIVFSISKDFVSILLYKEDECLCPSVQGHALFLGVPGDAPAASERLLGRPRIPTLAERSPRNIWVESTRCGEPATRNEGASGKLSAVSEISDTVRHGPPYVLYGDDLGEAKIQGVVVD